MEKEVILCVLLIIGYLFIAGIVAGIIHHRENPNWNEYDGFEFFCGMFFPMLIIVLLIYIPMKLFCKLGEWIASKFDR